MPKKVKKKDKLDLTVEELARVLVWSFSGRDATEAQIDELMVIIDRVKGG